jgi:hypothetical protein
LKTSSSWSTLSNPQRCTRPPLRLAAIVAAGLAFLPAFLSHVPSGPPSLMTISTPLQPSHPSFIKMEDRKRSAGDDLAPPTKRQAVNGKASADADLPWASDLEVCHCRHRRFSCPSAQDPPKFIHSSHLQDIRGIHPVYHRV